MFSILTIDDDPGVLQALRTVLSPPAPSPLDALADEVLGEAWNEKAAEKAAERAGERASGKSAQSLRFAVKSCASGEAGVAWLRTQVAAGTEPGVAFVDMRMPGGWDGLRTIRALWEASPDLQIVICTAYSDYAWEDLIESLGVTDSLLVIKKPFDALEVRQAALSLSEKWRLGRERAALQSALSQSQRLEVIGRMASGIAHDFNNLIMALMGEVAMLEAGVGDCEELKNIQEIIVQATEMTRSLSLFGQARRGGGGRAARVEVGALLGSSRVLLNRLIPERVQFRVHVSPDTPPVQIVPSEMQRVILNLVINAVDAMPDGGCVEVSTTLHTEHTELDQHDTNMTWMRLVVSDQGMGLSEAVRRRLFEPFFTTKSQGKGTGLGLVIVREIVERAGGRISVRSTPGEGTTFEILLPAAPRTP